MSKRTERSDESNPFDSRRTTRVAVFTPRNPKPAAVVPAPDENGDAVRAAASTDHDGDAPHHDE